MNNVHKDIEIASRIIENKDLADYNIQNYAPIYLFTTENIKGIINNIDILDKNILTVSSSSDHIFNMLLAGAKSIECYDINIFTKYYYYLKAACVKTFTYDEFLLFFFPTRFKNRVFDDNLFYWVIANIEDSQAKEFWSSLFKEYGGKKIYYSNLFINLYFKSTYMECNNYLNNEDSYKALQQRLNNYNYKFYLVDIFNNIKVLPNKKYDFLYLSNILDKLSCNSMLDYALKVKEILLNLNNYIVDNGIIGVCYLYCYLDDYWDSISDGRLRSSIVRNRYFKDSYYYKSFNGINNLKGGLLKDRDALMLTLKK
ncbi:MAG: DUF3419 family protein [Bacilli bacterium]|nr:DUF3419 family protein [Bacilli bacterium]